MLLLSMYMPMVADSGGNTGSQSAPVIIRALALGEVRFADIFRVLFKEFASPCWSGRFWPCSRGRRCFFSPIRRTCRAVFPSHRVGAVIGLALGLQVVTSTLIGALLPLVAVRLKVDPAVAVSPMLTTIVDITGLLIYFGMAGALLGV